MIGYFRRLYERAQVLGNHSRKFLLGIDRMGRQLIDRLEASGRFDRVRLLQPAADVGLEMDAVLEAGRDERERLALLGCYHAIQYLHVNFRAIDFLGSSARRSEDPTGAYREFLWRVGDDFSALVREYVRRLLDTFLAGAPRPEFVVVLVGTRLHQDDVDLAVIDDGGPGRENLNRAVGRLSQELIRWGASPDFYLSEHIGEQGYSASLAEYLERLDTRILDFVSVSEILSACPIAGSLALYERFRREVEERFYFGRVPDPRQREGYLRGLLGEIESLILWPKNPRFVNPKDDLLRLVNAILSAYRTIFRAAEPDASLAFEELGRALPEKGHLFRELEAHRVFVETFRHLYQQFAAQEEMIDLEGPKEQEALEQVARTMGYEGAGVVRAWQQLLVYYFERTRAGRRIVEALVPEVKGHIKKVTLFNEWLADLRARGSGADPRKRPALEFLERVKYFEGIKYWHDILDELEAEENGCLGALFADLQALDEAERERTLRGYAEWGHETFFTMLRLLTIFGKNAKAHRAENLFRTLDKVFLGTIRGTADEIRRFSTVFMWYPNLVYRYLSMAGEETHGILHERLSGEVWDPQVAAWQRRLLDFLEVVRHSSPYFRRVIDRVCARHPECLLHLAQLEELERMARGILADVVRLPARGEERDDLGVYYDVQLLRIGLGTLRGHPLEKLDAESAELSDQYVSTLFDACKAEVESEMGRRFFTHDLLGVFLAGGHAKERAHQDDYDLLVLLDSEAPEMLEYANRVLARLNREIVRRGIIPQYRLGDIFGAYVTRFSELEKHLKGRLRETFIEASQVAGARMVVGSSRLAARFEERLVRGCIFSEKRTFYRALAEEVIGRRRAREKLGPARDYDVKESEGGLRDIEMAMLILKVRHEILGPVGMTFLRELAERHPEEGLPELAESYAFLNRLRDVYRLTVGPSNFLDPAQFERPARILGYIPEAGRSAAERLREDFCAHCERTSRKLYALIEEALKE